MSKGRHGRGFHQIKKKKKSRHNQAEPVAGQPVASQPAVSKPVESAAPVLAVPVREEKAVEAAGNMERPVAKQGRNIAMMADLRMVAILAAVMLVVLIILSQVMG